MQQTNHAVPAIVPMPAEIDVNNAAAVLDLIGAALEPEVTVVVADLTATAFCDSSGLRHLLLAQERAGVNGTRLRFVVPAASSVRRILELTGASRMLDLYPSLADALAAAPMAT